MYNVFHIGHKAQMQYDFDKQLNRLEAQKNCSMPWASPEYDYSGLYKEMKKQNVTKVWIGIKKKTFTEPRWLNSSYIGKTFRSFVCAS